MASDRFVLEQKIDKMEVNMGRLDRIVNGTENEDVRVDDGQLVPSIRKWQEEMEAEYAVPPQDLIDAVDQSKANATSAEESAQQAVAAAEQVEQNAEQIAQDAAQQAVDNVVIAVDGAVDRAEGAAERAETASDAAFVNADVYPDIATGLVAVADGEQFQVVEGKELVRYLNQGGAAIELARIVAESIIATNRRINAAPQRDYFVAGEVTARVSSTDAIAPTPTWSVVGGELVVEADQVGNVFRYFDTGEYWSGGQPMEAEVEVEYLQLLEVSGPAIQVGTGGTLNSVRLLYASNGAIGTFSALGVGENATIYPGMEFGEGEKVALRVLLLPDGSGYLEARRPGRVQRHPIQLPTARGMVAPALRRVSGVTITRFSVRTVDPELLLVPELDSRVSALEQGAPSGDALATNRRIAEFPLREYFVPTEIEARSSQTDTPTPTPTWEVTGGHLVVAADQVGTQYRYFDTGAYWAGSTPVEVLVECEFQVNEQAAGPSFQLGAGGTLSSTRLSYASNGNIGAFTATGSPDAANGGASAYPDMAFSVGEVVSLRAVILPDGSGYLEARRPGRTQRHPIQLEITRGLVAPALRRIAGVTITRFRVRPMAPELLQIPELEERVTELEQGGSSGDVLMSATPKPLPYAIRRAALNHAAFYGQSNSIGATVVGGTLALSLTQPYYNVTFAGGPRAWDGGWSYLPTKPLVEDDDNTGGSGSASVPLGETQCSGAANYASTLAAIRGVLPSDLVILASTGGRGSYRIDQLQKGTSWYPNLIAQFQAGVDTGSDYVCHYVGWIQGEADANQETAYGTYRTMLENLQSDIETDAQAVSGQSEPIPMLISQVTAYSRKNHGVARAQFDAARDSDRIFIVTSSYRFPYGGNIHFTNVGAKLNGAYFGRAHDALLQGYQPECLMPISAVLSGTVVRVRFDVPHLPMRLDTVQLAATADYGFQVRDEQGVCDIQTVEVQGPDVVITLVSEPQGTSVVRYALDYAGSGRSVSGGQEGCGNLRDSAPEKVTIDSAEYQLFNASPAFELPVVRLGF